MILVEICTDTINEVRFVDNPKDTLELIIHYKVEGRVEQADSREVIRESVRTSTSIRRTHIGWTNVYELPPGKYRAFLGTVSYLLEIEVAKFTVLDQPIMARWDVNGEIQRSCFSVEDPTGAPQPVPRNAWQHLVDDSSDEPDKVPCET